MFFFLLCFFLAMGTCLPVYGKKQGEQCYRDTDCESGFLCLESMCQTPMPGVKGLGKWRLQIIYNTFLGIIHELDKGVVHKLRLQGR